MHAPPAFCVFHVLTLLLEFNHVAFGWLPGLTEIKKWQNEVKCFHFAQSFSPELEKQGVVFTVKGIKTEWLTAGILKRRKNKNE